MFQYNKTGHYKQYCFKNIKEHNKTSHWVRHVIIRRNRWNSRKFSQLRGGFNMIQIEKAPTVNMKLKSKGTMLRETHALLDTDADISIASVELIRKLGVKENDLIKPCR